MLAFGLSGAHASAVTFATNSMISAGDATYDGLEIVVQGCTLTVNGLHTFARLTLLDGAVLTHSPCGDGTDPALRLDIAVTGDLRIDASSRVDVSGRGYACLDGKSYGPGAATGTRSDNGGGGGGGAYGGNGGNPESPYAGGKVYGSVSAPAEHGSAGGAGYAGQGGAGGGYVRLQVGGELQLDGQILAHGQNGSAHSFGASGGGAGGGVWLTASQFSGTGQISANGGLGHAVSEEDSGGGGGGRVAVHFQSSTFSGSLSARGGAGGNAAARCGGAGSVFVMPLAESGGRLLVDNGGLEGVATPWIDAQLVNALVVSNRATIELFAGTALAVPEEVVVGPLGTLLCRATNHTTTAGDRWIGSGVTITSAVIRVEVQGLVTASGQGYLGTAAAGSGPGGGTGTRNDTGGGGGGGGYGGNGGNPESPFIGGGPYGSITQPDALGSAGGAGYAGNGGAGGGAIHVVAGALQLDGALAADGLDGQASYLGAAGGGAGGSLWIEVESLSGSGLLSARGGAASVVSEEDGGGGGGGRIALYLRTNQFLGDVRASGGSGYQAGGPGSIYWHELPVDRGRVVFDNAGQANSRTTWIGPNDRSAVVLTNGAQLELLGGDTLATRQLLAIAANSALLCRSIHNSGMVDDSWQGAGVAITTGTLRVEAGGLLAASGQGYTGTSAHGNGPGGGTGTRSDNGGGGGGGGHGGNGGSPQSPYAGGGVYDSVTQPLSPGSAGGAGYAGNGGAGGGAVKIAASLLDLDGEIRADGLAGGSSYLGASGGGAGGSLWLQVGAIRGAGLLSANGGSSFVVSEEDGGGGGGGRIAIYYSTNTFAGQVQAYGGLSGSGAGQGQAGGAGTIYLQSAAQTAGNLIVDNREVLGALTPWPAALTLDETTVGRGGNLEIRGDRSWTGAALYLSDGGVLHLGDAASLRLNALTLASNALVYCHGQNRSGQVDETWAGRGVTIHAQTAVIEAGAIITADGEGYAGTSTKGNGPGAGDGWRNDDNGGGSGGAHGGNGGPAEGPWIAGSGYGSAAHPLGFGSAGGAGFAGPGANGGGALRMIVDGECVLDGLIAARGLNGAVHSFGAAGGGAGGSVWISAGTFGGRGTVDASGGNGAVVYEQDSGGGGGGRIAVEAGANIFEGRLVAAGGAGGVPGGAGTIYVRTSPQSVGNLVVDNGGLAGARTSLTGAEAFDHVQVRNRGLLELLAGRAFAAASITVSTNGILAPTGGAILLADTLTVEDGGLVQCESANRSAQVGAEWAGYGPEFLVSTVAVHAGGVLTATGQGYIGTDGRGGGPGGGYGTRSDSNGGGGGGGYGGAGGSGEANQPGGITYGSETHPLDLGSAGGAGFAGRGGSGGGAIRIIATRQVVVEGLLAADGSAGAEHSWGGSGGGAGGSIWISARRLSGSSGAIQAAGGRGRVVYEEDSGGGGGGRIALDVGSADFGGTLSVAGGSSGTFSGQPGTLVTNHAVPCVVTPAGGTASGNAVQFTLQFADPVTGLTQEDVLVGNGSVLALAGSGTTYVLTVQPIAGSRVTCVVPAGAAQSAGIPSAQSNTGFVTVSGATAPTLTAVFDQGAVRMTWPGEAGVQYQLESAASLPAAVWIEEGAPHAGTGGPLSIAVPAGDFPSRFFRLRIP